jgi:GT2 family glycosyltransferase
MVMVALGDRPDVVAMVPTLGRDDARLSRSLQSVVAQESDLRISIVCVANGGDPIAVLPPLTTLLSPGLNLGWAGGLTFARSVADAEFLWLVQDDMELDPGCLTALHEALAADQSLGAVSLVTVDAAGEVPAFSLGGVLSRDGEPRMLEWLPPSSVPPDQLVGLDRLDYVASRGTLVRATAWDAVGGPDAQYYPVTWSDVDLCTALRAAGWGFGLVTTALARHQQRGSTPNEYGQFLFRRNNERFARKWGNERRAPSALPALDPSIPPSLVADIAQAASAALGDLAVAYGAARAEIEQLRVDVALARHEIEQVRRSHSWRLTAPLRAVRGRARRPSPDSLNP